MCIIKTHDEIVVTGFSGYDPRTYRRFQTEAHFVKWTWPMYSSLSKPHENIGNIVIPRLFTQKEGPKKFHHRAVIPVKLILRVEFGSEESY